MEYPIQLLRVSDQTRVDGRLLRMSAKHLADFERDWQPLLRGTREGDESWDWERKNRIYGSRLGSERYAVECETQTQGLMLLETRGYRSWVEEDRRIVYVRALATAPWNRPSLQSPPRYRFVGTALLDFARYRSEELGYDGLVGLHALPGAEGFYRRNGMLECGSDSEEDGLLYFEYYRRRRSVLADWEDEIDWEQSDLNPPEVEGE